MKNKPPGNSERGGNGNGHIGDDSGSFIGNCNGPAWFLAIVGCI